MKITKINIENYRGAEKLPLLLDPQLNVFYGANGSGKSTVLDAIAIMLSWAVSRIRHAGASGRQIDELDIRNNESVAQISLSIEDGENVFSWHLVKNRQGVKGTNKKSNFKELTEFAISKQVTSALLAEKTSLPIFAYYPVNRVVLKVPLEIKGKHDFTPLTAYTGALTSGTNFTTFFEWFREREDLENEQRRDSSKDEDDRNYEDSQLQSVRDAILALTGFSNIRVVRNGLRMEVYKEGKVLNVRQLSDGEKCLFALVGDLARRLAIANPALNQPLEGEGIVLIDEIDLHLHPEWQHLIIPRLLETFPNCQFIITTHSPQVLSHVPSKSLWCLSQKNGSTVAVQPEGSYGHDSNFLLKTLFGSKYRPEEIDQDFVNLFDLIKGDKKAARNLLSELKNKIEGDTPDLIRAEALLHRREVMGK